MEKYITLLGTENVRSAANTMKEAADIMRGVAGNLEDSLHRHRIFLDEWISRLESIMEK